ncbi:type II secretion system F family protein [Nocardiopsis changdeensis]|uniref:Type II secretion system F family protein n=1 Tax=Nocardiopsis changdeensis TaxID=2831969 RepID=A0ABX8BQ02_9ACTN|nr:MULTISPECIES: type II secretion system F family protein [Nocardiopsis]QUX24159.1 type II secretion system F family protein [Nocardiopsis changdeensis]QYX34554.1 type II secretion system F family protein [Nocardiopsis sp. MT53]
MAPWWDWTVGALVLGGVLAGAGIACAAYTLSLFPGRVPSTGPGRWVKLPSRRGTWTRAACAAAAGTVTGLVTGWPVGAVLAAAAGWWMPALLGPDTTTRAQADLGEALASWAEQLRDMLTGASGLHQAVTATVPVAPDPVRDQVRALDARLRAGQSMERAAAVFAREVDSDLGDLIAVALTMGASHQSGDLGGALSRLAEAARERATTVARVSASRAQVRSSIRIIAAATAFMLLGMTVFNPSFLAPLGTVSGQLVLALTGGLWAASFFWLARLASPPGQARPFTLTAVPTAGAGGAG